jgi:hypothetical protein
MAFIGTLALRTALIRKLAGDNAAEDKRLAKRVSALLADGKTANEDDGQTRLNRSLWLLLHPAC